MNIFMPEETIYDSVKALDDKRLIKQILECKTILDIALDETKKGYAKHPVVVYYKDYPKFVFAYMIIACEEYEYRFRKPHKILEFTNDNYDLFERYCNKFYGLSESVKPFYCEGSIKDTNCIRTTENTVELFRNKLCKKWDNDKYPPKWTNREPPVWYKSKR